MSRTFSCAACPTVTRAIGGTEIQFKTPRHALNLIDHTNLHQRPVHQHHAYALDQSQSEKYQRAVHDKHGSIVRLKPGFVQFSDPAAMEAIYGPKDGKVHSVRRKKVAHLYSQASALQFEPYIDKVIKVFFDKMQEKAESGETIDMALWLRRYTFNVIGAMFYGAEGGFRFIRHEIDFNNWLLTLDYMPKPISVLSSVPYSLKSMAACRSDGHIKP
ncbi:cytochrome P450 [Leptodontidium sp. 2 PMI_412]|nr:cytochrome P450 [Leptodontidium sp. 2 PMI_412]